MNGPLSVESIMSEVYGSAPACAAALNVGRSAVSNWKAWGHFPTRKAIQIAADAKQKRLKISLSDIPTMDNKRATQ